MTARLLVFLFVFCFSSCKQEKPDLNKKLSLEYEIKLPTKENDNQPVLFLFHGYGSHEKDLLGMGSQIDNRLTIICPRAPISLQEGRNAWYNLTLNQGGSRYKYDDVLQAQNQIKTFIKEAIDKHQLQGRDVYVGGFSQGAIMSLHLGLSEPDIVDGVIALSGHLLPELKKTMITKGGQNKLDIFMSHGRIDNVLSFAQAKQGEEYLEKQGIKIDEHWYDTKHTISGQNFQDMKAWIIRKMN